MVKRVDRHFQVNSPVTLTEVSDPAHQFKGLLEEISAAAMKLVTDHSLAANARLCVETEHHLVLADVRACEPRGNRFVVNARKAHTLAKLMVPESLTGMEKVQAVLEDCGLAAPENGAPA